MFAFRWCGRRALVLLLLVCVSGLAARCAPKATACAPYDFGLPAGVAPPPHPPDACVTPARVTLGRRLFYDRRLSKNQTQSCATCHIQGLAFTDGRARARGSTGQIHARNTLGLANAGYFRVLTWSNPELSRFDNQALIPFFSEDTPTTIQELAVTGIEYVITDRLLADPEYPGQFRAAFPEEAAALPETGDPGAAARPRSEPIRRLLDISHIARALASFEATITSFRSPYDRGELSPAARRGQALFFSERAGCFGCHGGPLLNEDAQSGELSFQNVGLYNVGGRGDYPDQAVHGAAAARQSQGLYLVTGRTEDRGKFRTPSLRNVALTAPYMHDGSLATLADVIDHFNAGGRNVRGGPLAGDGRAHPNKDPRVRPLGLSANERADLRAFLEALGDDCFISDPRFSDPAGPPPTQPAHCR